MKHIQIFLKYQTLKSFQNEIIYYYSVVSVFDIDYIFIYNFDIYIFDSSI